MCLLYAISFDFTSLPYISSMLSKMHGIFADYDSVCHHILPFDCSYRLEQYRNDYYHGYFSCIFRFIYLFLLWQPEFRNTVATNSSKIYSLKTNSLFSFYMGFLLIFVVFHILDSECSRSAMQSQCSVSSWK